MRNKTATRHTDAVPVVQAELSPTAVPRNLLPTIMWIIGAAAVVLGVVVSVLVILDHRASAEKDHDSKFQTKEGAEKHEREDITAIRGLTDAINQLSQNAEVSRQYLLLSNKKIESSVSDLISRQCRKDNFGSKDISFACEKEIRAAEQAAADVRAQTEKASTTTSNAQVTKLVPPKAP